MMYYRAVEIKDGESAEPVNVVGVHPIKWSRIADGPPTIGFVEADDTIDALVEACEKVIKWVLQYMDFGERACPFCGHHHNHSNECPYVGMMSAILTAARQEAE